MPAAAHVSYPADGVGLILLDNPPMNFASNELLEKVEAAYDEIEKAGARVVLLASDVPGYFIAHAHIPDILNAYTGGPTTGDPRVWRRLTDKLERGALTSIAVVHGQAWGGGADLCYACTSASPAAPPPSATSSLPSAFSPVRAAASVSPS